MKRLLIFWGALLLASLTPTAMHLHEILIVEPLSVPARTKPREPNWSNIQEVKVLMDIPQTAYCLARKADDCFEGSVPGLIYVQSGDSLVLLVPYLRDGKEPKR